jgi:hypothetical protein
MRLVLVHGINQQGKDAEALKTQWLCFLADQGLGKPGAFDAIDVVMPFYGDALKEWADGTGANAISQGPGGAPNLDEAQFLTAALMETATAAGVGRAAIENEQRTIAREQGDINEQSLVMNRRFNAIVRVLEKISPVHGTWVMKILKQAYVYVKNSGAAESVDAIVGPALEKPGPMVIVAHSLGTVVTFKLLRQLATKGTALDVPLFVTVGSPLSLMAIQTAIGPAFARPAGVKTWLNALDPDDFITLGKPLDEINFGTGITNIVDIENDHEDAHFIGGYLGDKRVASAVAKAVGIAP